MKQASPMKETVQVTTTTTTTGKMIPQNIQDRLKKKAKIDKGRETVKPTVINDELIR
jgi:hypothetical protein